jgi:hypothetical protein
MAGMRPARHGAAAAAADALARPSAVLLLRAAPEEVPARLAEIAAQRGPYGLPIARGSLAVLLATEDPHAPWRHGRALPFAMRVMDPRADSARAAALAWARSEGEAGSLLILPAAGAPIPADLVYSLRAGLAAADAGCLREVPGGAHLAIRLDVAEGLPEGQEAAALRQAGKPTGRAVPAPETPPPPRRPGLFERWLMRRLELA